LAKLIINPTSGARKEIPVGDKVLSIGRDPSNDLVLSDSMVSRRHAIMERKGEDYVIRDNNSSNGTVVNGDRVSGDQPLRDGDLIAIGSARLLFQMDSEESEPSGPDTVLPPVPKPAESATEGPGEACPACGLAASPSDRFCRRCGEDLSAKKPQQTVCEHCKAAVDLPAEFCGSCGKPLKATPVRRAVPTKPKPRSPSERSTKDKAPPIPATPKVPPAPRGRQPVERTPGRRPGSTPAATKGEPAGFWIRFAAYLIDYAILMIPMVIVLGIYIPMVIRSAQEQAATPSIWLVLLPTIGGLLTLVLSIVYPLYFWVSRGATPGKSLLGLKIITTDGHSPIGMKSAVLRLVGYMINGFTFGIGFLLIALSEDKRGLHDRIAETAVVRRR
jgi:pSer/pThr/pTyr-binding forkhead associated (FHA) protein/uncharacterized RDD family membrane protein YckC